MRAQARPSFSLLDRAFQGLGRNGKEGPFESVDSTAFARTHRQARAPGEASAAPAPVGARSARPLRSFGARGMISRRLVSSSSRRPPAAEGGGFPHERPRTTGRRDDRIAPARLRDEGDDYSSSRQLVVPSSSRRGRGRPSLAPALADSPSLPTPRSPARSAKPFLHAKVAKSAKTVEGAFLENRRTERNSSLRKTSRKSAHNQRTSGGHAAEIGTRRNKQ